MTKYLIVALLLVAGVCAYANECVQHFQAKDSTTAVSRVVAEEELRAEVREQIYSDRTIQDVFSKDPELQKLANDPHFINFVVGLSEGRSLNELKYSLFRVWGNAVAANFNLNKTLTKELLREVSLLGNKPNFKQARRLDKIRYAFASLRVQMRGFFSRLFFVRNLIRTELSPRTLDGRVFDFYGYLNLKLDVSALRPWTSVPGSFGAIQLGQVRDINPAHFARIAMLAAEIEQPVDAYSNNSGEVLRVISPQATRFMGKTDEEAQAHKKRQEQAIADGKPKESWCTNSWCVEENRHEGTLARIAQMIVGWPLKIGENFTSYPNLNPMNPKDAYFHLYARNDTEWHAGSAYFLLAAHSEGPLREWVLNVTRDEVKHMSLFGGLYKYLKGDTYWGRLKEMLKKTLLEIKEKTASGKSEYGALGIADGLTMFEVAYIHVVYEANIRKFFRSLPLKSLRKIYETEINLKPLPTEPVAPEKQAQMDLAIEKETEMRKSLARWRAGQRESYDNLEYFEFRNNPWMTHFIKTRFGEFRGVEVYMGEAHKRTLKEIDDLTAIELEVRYQIKLSKAELALLKTSLRETLRDYQIFNNETVRSLGLNVVFIDAVKGFDIARDAAYDAAKKVRERP